MEVILLLLAAIVELIAGLLVPVIVLAVGLAATAISYVVGSLTKSRGRGDIPASPSTDVDAPASAQSTASPSPLRIWSRRIAYVTGAITAVVFILVVGGNYFFFDKLVHTLAAFAAGRDGIAIEFDSVDGNLVRGKIHFKNLRLERTNHPQSNYDVHIEDVSIEFRLTDFVAGDRRISMLKADGVLGDYERVAAADPITKTQFTINQLAVSRAAIQVSDRAAKAVIAQANLAVDELQIDGYDSQWAAFDVMFDSTVRGRIEEHPFEITHGLDGSERWARWKADRIPVPLVIAYLGGPLRVLTDGRAKIDVTNRWKGDTDPDVDMHWQIDFEEVKVGVPEGANPFVAKFTTPVVTYINANSGRIPLDFHVVMPQKAFLGKASLETVGVWDVVRKSAARTFAAAVGEKFDEVAERAFEIEEQALKEAKLHVEKVREVGKKAVDRFKDLFKERKADRKKLESEKPPAK